MHRTAPRFWRHFEQLPESVQRVARQNFERLQEDPRHPSLHFGRVGNYWSVRVGRGYRALAIQDGDDFIWFWVGGHDEYMRII